MKVKKVKNFFHFEVLNFREILKIWACCFEKEIQLTAKQVFELRNEGREKEAQYCLIAGKGLKNNKNNDNPKSYSFQQGSAIEIFSFFDKDGQEWIFDIPLRCSNKTMHEAYLELEEKYK